MLIKIKIPENSALFWSYEPRIVFFLLINDKVPTIVGILTVKIRKNFMLSLAEHVFFATALASRSDIGVTFRRHRCRLRCRRRCRQQCFYPVHLAQFLRDEKT